MDRQGRERPSETNAIKARSGSGSVWGRADWLLLLSLIAATIVVFWRLALTELIIGRGDLFFYFYPYRDYASAAVRDGRVPLWNPYSFMAVPFLANSQAGFFYPLNLILAWLPVERMVNASIVLHAALAAAGAYLWGRGRLGLSRAGAWLGGVSYGLGGYFVAQVEHLNQVQVLAWLPWLLWLFDWPTPADGSRAQPVLKRALRLVGLGLVFALQFFAGHTQSVFICLVGLTGYAVLPVLWDVIRRRTPARELLAPLGLLAGASLLGAGLAAAQLLPTFELSRLSIRSGGLPINEAVSFSLRPGLVARALLPGWGPPLFPEFIAYVGVFALGLAAAGAVTIWRGHGSPYPDTRGEAWRSAQRKNVFLARRGALVLAVLGLFLALGGYNPLYYLLVKLVPGFGLFRAPARWLALYAVGVSGLAGIGLDAIVAMAAAESQKRAWRSFARSLMLVWLMGAVALALGLLLGQWLGSDQLEDLAPPLGISSVVGWLLAALVFGAVLYFFFSSQRLRAPRILLALLIVLVSLELLGASFFLPLNRATAPGALTSLRPAVAHLQAEAHATVPGPPDRFLSISDIAFDPGDKTEIEIILQPQLSANAVYDYIIATKQKEVLIPNLPLYYRLPAMDGYDGGVLPLQRYVTLEQLYMPEDGVAIDGRLREHLDAVPAGRWLSLFNVRFVITDKVRDAWFDDVFYDLQLGARLANGDEAAVGYIPSTTSTALGIVYEANGAIEGTPLAYVDMRFSDGQEKSLSLVADDVDDGERIARLQWDRPATPESVRVRGAWETGAVNVRGLSLIDERTGAFFPLVLSDNGRYRLVHSGDVKIYENLDVIPRAFFVRQAVPAPDDEAALAAMRAGDFDPTATVVLVDDSLPPNDSRFVDQESRDTASAKVEITLYEPERVIAFIDAPANGWLVLSDSWYPGWQATVDGVPVPVERANILFRAVAVPEGQHYVEWVFRPWTFRLGAVISLSAIGLMLLILGWVGFSRALHRYSS